MSVGLGMMAYAIKEKDAGRELPDADNLTKWVVEGVDRSGLTSIGGDANNILEKVTRGRLGMNAITGDAPMSRYVSRNLAGAIAGPSFGAAMTAAQVVGAASTGDWRKSDVSAFFRLAPYQNLTGWRQGWQALRDGVADSIGADE